MSESTPELTNAEEATLQDKFLDKRLAEIRRQQDAGIITVREAADLRVRALEHHLDAVRALRTEQFGQQSLS
jgi:hypothetical protein